MGPRAKILTAEEAAAEKAQREASAFLRSSEAGSSGRGKASAGHGPRPLAAAKTMPSPRSPRALRPIDKRSAASLQFPVEPSHSRRQTSQTVPLLAEGGPGKPRQLAHPKTQGDLQQRGDAAVVSFLHMLQTQTSATRDRFREADPDDTGCVHAQGLGRVLCALGCNASAHVVSAMLVSLEDYEERSGLLDYNGLFKRTRMYRQADWGKLEREMLEEEKARRPGPDSDTSGQAQARSPRVRTQRHLTRHETQEVHDPNGIVLPDQLRRQLRREKEEEGPEDEPTALRKKTEESTKVKAAKKWAAKLFVQGGGESSLATMLLTAESRA